MVNVDPTHYMLKYKLKCASSEGQLENKFVPCDGREMVSTMIRIGTVEISQISRLQFHLVLKVFHLAGCAEIQ